MKPGTALVIHPNWSFRDPYGVITDRTLRDVAAYAQTWKSGWDDRTFTANLTLPHETRLDYARYSDVRDYVLGLVDLPFYHACEIALWITRCEVQHHDGSRATYDIFFPVL